MIKKTSDVSSSQVLKFSSSQVLNQPARKSHEND